MLPEIPCNVDFFEWLDSLSDEDHRVVLELVRKVNRDLCCRVNRQPIAAQQLFDLTPHRNTFFSLN